MTTIECYKKIIAEATALNAKERKELLAQYLTIKNACELRTDKLTEGACRIVRTLTKRVLDFEYPQSAAFVDKNVGITVSANGDFSQASVFFANNGSDPILVLDTATLRSMVHMLVATSPDKELYEEFIAVTAEKMLRALQSILTDICATINLIEDCEE